MNAVSKIESANRTKEKLAVLMYHAVADADGLGGHADAHYAVSKHQFSRHLDLMQSAGLRARSVASLCAGESAMNSVAMTFDDGDASNGAAAQGLADRGFSADFFVNPSTVGQTGFLSWAELRTMAASGMSIQSHGHHHRYLDELSPGEVTAELVDSKREIEDRLGQSVTVFAPPGGRTPPGLAQSAANAGYGALCTSRVGWWRTSDSHWQIPRVAVLNSTAETRLLRWLHCDWQEMAAQRTRHAILSSAKRILGNRGYERVRQGLLRTSR